MVMLVQKRLCRHCGEWLPVEEFITEARKNGSGKPSKICNDCRLIVRKKRLARYGDQNTEVDAEAVMERGNASRVERVYMCNGFYRDIDV